MPAKGARFLNVDFDSLTPMEVLDWVRSKTRSDRFEYLVTPNVDHLNRLDAEVPDGPMHRAYECASLRLCDSRVVQRLAKLSSLDLPLVTGSDLTSSILSEDWLGELTIAVIGGDADLINRLRRMAPAKWVQHIPPMGVLRDRPAQEAIARFVEAEQADITFFAFGAPQSEVVCDLIAGRGRARGVGLCIGASLDFATGRVQRAPRWVQKLGLEWLHRLVQEPRRLARRYLLVGPNIFRIWARQHLLLRLRGGSGSS